VISVDEIISILKQHYPEWMDAKNINNLCKHPINVGSYTRKFRSLRRSKMLNFRLHETRFPKKFLYQYKKGDE
jgi:hypothetical protein